MAVKCPACGAEFDSNLKLVDHFLLAHASDAEQWELIEEVSTTSDNDLEKTKYSNLFHNACDICGDIKSSPRKLANHILSHLGTMPYFCFPCSFSCISKLRLQQHIYNHATHKSDNQRYWLFTKSNLHECESCDKNFATWMDLVFHYSNHIISMPYKCNECWLYFNDMKDFIIHSHLHKRTTVCEMCDIFFDTRPRLLDHVLEHNKSKMFRKFRHIAWNDGLSSIRNPFSVLRADYFGNSFHRVFYDPNCSEIDNDSLIRCDLMINSNKQCANDEPDYEDREDVTHLCEIVFKEFSDNDSYVIEFNNIFNQHVKTTSSHNQVHTNKLPFVSENMDCIQNFQENENVSQVCSDRQNSVTKLKNAKSNKNNSKSVVSTCIKNKADYSASAKTKSFSIVLEKLPKYVCDLKSFRKYNENKRIIQLRTRSTQKRKASSSVSNTEVNLSKHDTDDKKSTMENNSLTMYSDSSKNNEKKKLKNHFEKRKLINIKTRNTVVNKRVLRSGKVVNIKETEENDSELDKTHKEKEFKFSDRNTVFNDKILNHNKPVSFKKCKKSHLKLSKCIKRPINSAKCVNVPESDQTDKRRQTNLKYIQEILENKHLVNNNVSSDEEKLPILRKLASIKNLRNSIAENTCDSNISPKSNIPFSNKSNYSEVMKKFRSSYRTRRNIKNSVSVDSDQSISNQAPEIISELSIINHDHNYQASGLFNNLPSTSSNHKRTKIKHQKIKSAIQKCAANRQKKFLLNRKQNMLIKKKRIKNICFKSKSKKTLSKSLISKAKSQKLSINLVRLPSYIYEKYLKKKPIMLSSVSPIISSVESLSIVPTPLTVQNVHSLLEHSYSDSLPAILDDHNYCKLHYEDSDSESTLSSYSYTL